MIPRGNRIRLNASVKATGYIKVAVRRFDQGEDLPGRGFDQADRIVGDGLDIPVTWQGEAEIPHEGTGIILRFQLRQAKVFGIEFVS